MLEIGYLGPEGTFSQEAAMKYIELPGEYKEVNLVETLQVGFCKECKNLSLESRYKLKKFNTIPELISAVQSGGIDEAIVPIENSLEGAVNATMDMLTSEEAIMIGHEIVVPVRQNLLTASHTNNCDIKYIISHPQAIGQCRGFISREFPEAEIIYVHSTAAAAEIVANGKEKSAAIGSKIAADVYGLRITAEDIQDGNNNMTRFVVLSKSDSKRTGCDKTSIAFSTEDKPGSLYRILDIFNLWDINMSRIESRPAKNQLGSYIFFIDIEGHRDDENVRDALTMIRRKVSFFKFLGSYPKYS